MKKEALCIVYELSHVAEARRMLEEAGESKVHILAIDAEVEEELSRLNIPFMSGKKYRGPVNLDRFFQSDVLVKKMFDSPEWGDLHYRGVALRILCKMPFRLYAVRILYYAELFLNLAKATEAKEWIICSSASIVLPTSGVLARQEIDVVVRTAQLVGKTLGIAVTRHELPRIRQRNAYWLLRGAFSRAAFEIALVIYNSVMRLFERRGALRIAATDYWEHLSSIFDHLKDADLLLYDRGEIAHIPPNILFRHRIRFEKATMSPRALIPEDLAAIWQKMCENLPDLPYRELDLRVVYRELFDAFYTDALPRALSTIDHAHTTLAAYRPNALLLRASVSRQLHFAILASVARELNIPSVEVQHGHEYVGEGALGNERAAEYIAVYGSLSQRNYQNIGYKKENLPIVGSPKFDVYKHVRHESKPGTLRLLHVVPWFGVGVSQLDAYDFYDYVHALGAAIKNVGGNEEVILKMRPGRHREDYFHRVLESGFKDVAHTIAHYESLDSLFTKTDAVITGHSTVVLEAMSAGVPVILYGQYPSQIERIHTQYTEFIEEEAVECAQSPQELTTILARYAHDETALRTLAEKGRVMVNKLFLFDGDSGKRIAEFLKKY